MRDTGLVIEYVPDHSLGPLYAAQGWEVEDDPESFERFVAWVQSTNPKQIWVEMEDKQCSWIFEPDSDGPFWLKVMWCSDIVIAGEYDAWDDDFDEREWFDQHEEWAREDAEIDEENEFARRLRTKPWGMNERAPDVVAPLASPCLAQIHSEVEGPPFVGQLIAIPDFRSRNPSGNDKSRPLNDSFWYFNDTIDHFQTEFDVTKTYPEALYIHEDWLQGVSHHYAGSNGHPVEDAGRLRVEIREWIEQNVSNSVIYDRINRNYYRAVPPKKEGNELRGGYEHDVRHGYYAFYFKTSAEATHFKLRFAGFVSNEMAVRHPDRPREEGVYDVREYHVATAISSPYGGIADPSKYEI